MDQLVNQIVQQTGIPQAQAQQAAQIVIDFLKGRLPGPVASQLDGVLGGQSGGPGGMMGQVQQNLGGLGGMAGQAEQELGGLGKPPQQ